jgi:hypothetical protein
LLFSALALIGCGTYDPNNVGTTTADNRQIAPEEDFPNGPPTAKVHYQIGHAKTAGGASTNNLIDHGGKVLSASNTYAIWWGTQSAWPSDVKSGIASLFQGLNGTNFLGIAQQYMRGASVSTTYHTNSLVDSSTSPPSRGPSTSTIVSEACKVITANKLTPDPTAIYFVFTSNFPKRTNYCAWHDHGTCNGVDIQVAYMPNTNGVSGCNPFGVTNLNCNSDSEGLVSLANVTSHEYMEAITDADITAWYDSSGSEIGDKCAWTFSSCVPLSTGSWQLQQEWSNSNNGCVQN